MSAAFWNRIAELEAKVTELRSMVDLWDVRCETLACRIEALEAKRPPGRPRKVEEAA